MGNVVKIVYQKQPKELSITCNGRNFDVSGIADKSLEQWVFPFYSDGERWNGLYEELRDFVGNDDFTIQFDGDDASFEILKYVLKYDPVELEKITQSVVTIMYSEDPFDTKITVDGKPFDVTRIQNRSIDEWMNVIDIRGMHWDGIFNELNAYIDSESYTIYFVGDQVFMEMMIAKCPSTVSIFYRDPQVSKLSHSSATSKQNFSQTINNAAESKNTGNIGDTINQYREAFKKIQSETFQGSGNKSGLFGKLSKFQTAVLSGGLIALLVLAIFTFCIFSEDTLPYAISWTVLAFVFLWFSLYVTTLIYILLDKYPRVQGYVKRFSPWVASIPGAALASQTMYLYAFIGISVTVTRVIVVIIAALGIALSIYDFVWLFWRYKKTDTFIKPLFLIYGDTNQGLSDEEYETWKKDHEARLQEAADKLNEAYKKAKESNNNNRKN